MKVVQMYEFLRSVIDSNEHKHMNEQYLKKLLSEGSEEMIGNELFPVFSEYVLKGSKDEVWTKTLSCYKNSKILLGIT